MRGAALAGVVLITLASSARAETWRSDLAESSVVVHVYRDGIFSAFAHDHHFEVTDWSATATLDEEHPEDVSVEVALSARSLRDRQQALSDEDRRKVNAQVAGPEVLDSADHPTITFHSTRFEVTGSAPGLVEGTLHGTLTVRGVSRPVEVPLVAKRREDLWSVSGSARVEQSAFGIEPYSGFAGTVRVEDEVEIELSLLLVHPSGR